MTLLLVAFLGTIAAFGRCHAAPCDDAWVIAEVVAVVAGGLGVGAAAAALWGAAAFVRRG